MLLAISRNILASRIIILLFCLLIIFSFIHLLIMREMFSLETPRKFAMS